MATFLTNSKMGSALRARIEASVRGGRSVAGSRVAPTTRATVRLILLLVVVASVVALATECTQRRRALASARQALLDDVSRVLAPLEANDANAWTAGQSLLAQGATDYAGDHIDPSLDGPAALEALLKRPTVYVRGPIASFSERAKVEAATAESVRDAFVLCLVAPPAASSENALLARVRAVYRGESGSDLEAAQIHRLHDAFRVEAFRGELWSKQVSRAGRVAEVDRMRERVSHAQLERAVQAAQAELLVYLLDEPKKPGTPSELDGASDHFVRVGIVELGSGEALLRLRRRVDPSWISERRRVNFARGLNACRLAVDVRTVLSPSTSD